MRRKGEEDGAGKEQMLILVLLLTSLFPLLRTSEDSVNGELFIVLSVCDVRAV